LAEDKNQRGRYAAGRGIGRGQEGAKGREKSGRGVTLREKKSWRLYANYYFR